MFGPRWSTVSRTWPFRVNSDDGNRVSFSGLGGLTLRQSFMAGDVVRVADTRH